jgi:hypothetical protein
MKFERTHYSTGLLNRKEKIRASQELCLVAICLALIVHLCALRVGEHAILNRNREDAWAINSKTPLVLVI